MTALRTRIYRGTERNLELLAAKLQQGELVAVPTETVYGLAANALDATACARVFKAKGRPTTDPLIVHLHDLSQVTEVAKPNDAAIKLAKKFWPGPLTMILPKTKQVPPIVTSGRSSVAVRIPAHPLFRRLLKGCALPLAAPSANPFGYVSPTTARHVRDSLNGRIRFILDGGPAKVGLESTIVDLRDPSRPKILRPGAISAAQIGRVLRCDVEDYKHQLTARNRSQVAPGQLPQHYSPNARVKLHKTIPDSVAASIEPGQAVLHFKKPAKAHGRHAYWLSATGNQTTAARSLFAKLRQIDQRGYRLIHVELAPCGLMSEAINDRLRRAAAKG
ncbi:MAG: L-threonylcarbamoyladenylate synthase [Opitutaceae bacterium]